LRCATSHVEYSVHRSAIAPERRASLERTAIRIFYQLDAKEQKREKLTPKEFELKSVVDDLLVRMLGGAAGGEAAVLTAPSPLPDAKPADDGHVHAPEGAWVGGCGLVPHVLLKR
jgi:hypothetical protein